MLNPYDKQLILRTDIFFRRDSAKNQKGFPIGEPFYIEKSAICPENNGSVNKRAVKSASFVARGRDRDPRMRAYLKYLARLSSNI